MTSPVSLSSAMTSPVSVSPHDLTRLFACLASCPHLYFRVSHLMSSPISSRVSHSTWPAVPHRNLDPRQGPGLHQSRDLPPRPHRRSGRRPVLRVQPGVLPGGAAHQRNGLRRVRPLRLRHGVAEPLTLPVPLQHHLPQRRGGEAGAELHHQVLGAQQGVRGVHQLPGGRLPPPPGRRGLRQGLQPLHGRQGPQVQLLRPLQSLRLVCHFFVWE